MTIISTTNNITTQILNLLICLCHDDPAFIGVYPFPDKGRLSIDFNYFAAQNIPSKIMNFHVGLGLFIMYKTIF